MVPWLWLYDRVEPSTWRGCLFVARHLRVTLENFNTSQQCGNNSRYHGKISDGRIKRVTLETRM